MPSKGAGGEDRRVSFTGKWRWLRGVEWSNLTPHPLSYKGGSLASIPERPWLPLWDGRLVGPLGVVRVWLPLGGCE